MVKSSFKVGDWVWFVAGHEPPNLIVIKCKILEIKTEDNEQTFVLDEPTSFDVKATDLFADRLSAMRELRSRIETLEKLEQEKINQHDLIITIQRQISSNLSSFRETQVGLLIKNGKITCSVDKLHSQYNYKPRENEDNPDGTWFKLPVTDLEKAQKSFTFTRSTKPCSQVWPK